MYFQHIFLLLLFSIFNTQPVLSCAKFSEEFKRQQFNEIFETQKSIVIQNLRKHFPSIRDIIFSETSSPTSGYQNLELIVLTSDGGFKLKDTNYEYLITTSGSKVELSSDVYVEITYREMGINSLFVSRVLSENPHINRLHDTLQSINQVAALGYYLGNSKQTIQQITSKKTAVEINRAEETFASQVYQELIQIDSISRQQKAEIKQKIVTAIMQTPLYSTYIKHRFSTVVLINVQLYPGSGPSSRSVSFEIDAITGLQNTSEDIKILIEQPDGRVIEL